MGALYDTPMPTRPAYVPVPPDGLTGLVIDSPKIAGAAMNTYKQDAGPRGFAAFQAAQEKEQAGTMPISGFGQNAAAPVSPGMDTPRLPAWQSAIQQDQPDGSGARPISSFGETPHPLDGQPKNIQAAGEFYLRTEDLNYNTHRAMEAKRASGSTLEQAQSEIGVAGQRAYVEVYGGMQRAGIVDAAKTDLQYHPAKVGKESLDALADVAIHSQKDAIELYLMAKKGNEKREFQRLFIATRDLPEAEYRKAWTQIMFQHDPEAMMKVQMAEKGFDLSPGQKRYDAQGKEIAANPAEPKAPAHQSIRRGDKTVDQRFINGAWVDVGEGLTHAPTKEPQDRFVPADRTGPDGKPVAGMFNSKTGEFTPSGDGYGPKPKPGLSEKDQLKIDQGNAAYDKAEADIKAAESAGGWSPTLKKSKETYSKGRPTPKNATQDGPVSAPGGARKPLSSIFSAP